MSTNKSHSITICKALVEKSKTHYGVLTDSKAIKSAIQDAILNNLTAFDKAFDEFHLLIEKTDKFIYN